MEVASKVVSGTSDLGNSAADKGNMLLWDSLPKARVAGCLTDSSCVILDSGSDDFSVDIIVKSTLMVATKWPKLKPEPDN